MPRWLRTLLRLTPVLLGACAAIGAAPPGDAAVGA